MMDYYRSGRFSTSPELGAIEEAHDRCRSALFRSGGWKNYLSNFDKALVEALTTRREEIVNNPSQVMVRA